VVAWPIGTATGSATWAAERARAGAHPRLTTPPDLTPLPRQTHRRIVLGHASPTTPCARPHPLPGRFARSLADRPRALARSRPGRRRRAPTGSPSTRRDEPVGRRRRARGGSAGHGGVFLGRPSQAGDPPRESHARAPSLCSSLDPVGPALAAA